MSERFEADWLSLREAADAAARDPGLVGRASTWLAERSRPLAITDLGAGSGANPRFLAPRLPGPQHWRLVDHDATLLARAADRLAGLRDADAADVQFETCASELADVDAAISENTDLATASALFDLVSADWIDALAARCRQVGCAALWTLSVDGDWRFTGPAATPRAQAADAAMRALLQAHQARDKGLGRALGGHAPAALRAAFTARGFDVFEAPSPWRLAPNAHVELAVALLDGWRGALLEQAPDAARDVDAWWRDRRARLEAGTLGVEVGHVDLYAQPAPRPGDAARLSRLSSQSSSQSSQ